MVRKLIRGILTLLGCVIGYAASLLILFVLTDEEFGSVLEISELFQIIAPIVGAIIFGFIFFILSPYIGKRGVKVAKDIESDLAKVPSNDIVGGTIGLVIGLVMAYLISRLYEGITFFYIGTILSLLTYLFLGYLGVVIGTRRGQDIIPNLLTKKNPAPKGKSKNDAATPKILDTSVIIDGRIADIMKTGFIEGNIVIPEFVLVELRHIADSSDGLKRNRGRRGLDVLNRIQMEYGIEIYNTASESALEEIPEVDVKLLKLAQIMNGKVVTNDYNLNKVAVIKGVEVLNINELANTLKPVVLPGEDMTLFLIKEGKENNQAVAYLDDGTMIVVEDGKRYIGNTIDATVTSVLQTSAGRMIFAKPKK